MTERIKKIAAWLFMTIMVLCLAAGCQSAENGPGGGAQVLEGASQHTVSESDVSVSGGVSVETASDNPMPDDISDAAAVDEHGSYNTKDEVALYLHTYGHLPDNYITKKEAQKLGWDSKKGNLEEVAPGKSIGGSHFGNYEGQLPEQDGREYYECDLEYEGGYRGAERLIYSNDGLIYYTGDHYKTFEKLY